MTCQVPIVENLRNHGVRITPQRELILESLCHGDGHMTADDVFARVEGRLPGLNIATVYRTLEMLRSARVLSMTHDAAGRAAFEVLQVDKDHHHLVCENCGATIEASPSLLEGLRQSLEETYGFRARLEHLSFSGRCSECQGT